MKLLPLLLGFLLLPLLSFSQSIDDTLDDDISGGKNILGVNFGALIFNELDLRYSRLIEISNSVQWNLQLGIGIPAGDYKTPFYLTDFDPRAYADFEWEEFTEAQISSSPRYTAGLHTFHAYTFPSTNIGIGGGWNVQYRQLTFTSSINDETYTQDMFAFGLALPCSISKEFKNPMWKGEHSPFSWVQQVS